ncbi:MAG: hemerythrin domain-containing protein [Anaerolineales bacterium]|nr:MAG: hemerythrin domain-containing protein [Anaerolineales bacterium]
MQAIDILMQEHRIIEKVLDSLETAANRLAAGEDVVPMEFFLQAADFIRNFADGQHHQKEEGILFVALDENGMAKDVEPVSVFMDEHEMARAHTRGMIENAERVKTGDASAKAQLVQHALDYVELLREHIQKEDNILFPIADNILDGQNQKLVADFKHADDERQTGETYLRLAEELASAFGK